MKPFPDEIKRNKCYDRSDDEYVSVLLAPTFNPADSIPTESKGVGSTQEPSLCAFEDLSLVDQIVQDFLSLRNESIKLCLCVLYKAVFSKGVLLP